MTDIAALIRARLDGPPGDPMIRYHGEWFDRAWMGGFVDRLGTAIDVPGLGPNAPIGLVAQNRPEFVAALLALIERGRHVVMIYAYQSGEAIARKLAELRLPLVIAAADQWPGAMSDAARAYGTAAVAIDRTAPGVDVLTPCDPVAGSYRAGPGEPGIELLTSGTTGPPKHFAIPYSRLFSRMVLDNAAQSEGRDRTLLYFPLGNISGVYLLLPAVAADHRIVLLDKFTVADWVDHIETTRPAVSNLPPAAFRMILDAGVDPARLASLDHIATGAATLDPALRREFEAAYDVAILQSYGATEFGGIVAAVTPAHIAEFGRAKSDSVGRPVGGATWRVVDAETHVPLASGREGRIEVSAPAMATGWIATTDLGLIDADGFLYHRGRLDGAIMRGGFKIIPEQVAAALCEHPSVAQAVVVGVPDARLGAVPAAAVLLRDGREVTAGELALHLRERLPATMLPVRYVFVDKLPRTPSLKVDLAVVRHLIETTSGQIVRD